MLGSLVVIKQENQLFFSAVTLVVPKRGNKNKILRGSAGAPYKINPWFITRFSDDSYINKHSFPFTKLFVFNEDKKTIAFVFDSIVNACRTLTLIKFPLDGKIYDSDLTKNKNIQFIWWVINKKVLTNTEVGKFYIFLNPGHSTSLALVVLGKNLQSYVPRPTTPTHNVCVCWREGETRWARNYSYAPGNSRPSVENFQLDPLWVTGFIDGEGCFHVSITENKELNLGWRVHQRFTITLHKKDEAILELIQKFFAVGQIYKQGPQVLQFRVLSSKDLKIIKNHFAKFPLKTKKRRDLELWIKVEKKIERREHLTLEGLRQIVGIKAAMNLGLSEVLQKAFPDVVPAERPNVKLPKTIDPHWLAGFTAAEGSFMVKIQKSKTRVGYSVYSVFKLTQHARDKQLMRIIFKYLDCGNIYKRGEVIDLRISKLSDILNTIIPFFKKYPIKGVKAKDFNDFCIVAEMMKNKAHLTKKRTRTNP